MYTSVCRPRIEVEAKKRFLELLKNRFNSPIKYKDKMWKWDTVIQTKAQEFGKYLLGKTVSLDFIQPSPILIRSDSLEMRRRILELNQKEANKLGIGKSTLHYLKKHSRGERPFSVYQKVAQRLQKIR